LQDRGSSVSRKLREKDGARRELRQFAQRISIDYHFGGALTLLEGLRFYVRHRLARWQGGRDFDLPPIRRSGNIFKDHRRRSRD